MIWSLLVLVLACLAAWLLYRFRLRKAYTRQQVRILFVPFLLISLILIANGLAVYYGRSRLAYLVETPFVRDTEEFSAFKEGDEILLRGTISPQNPSVDEEFAALVECEGRRCEGRIPEGGLLVDIKDGQVVISNADFAALYWPAAEEGKLTRRTLKAGDLIVSYGTVEAAPEAQAGRMQAELVFAGGGDAFRAEAQRNAILPKFLLVTSLFAAVVIVLLPIIAWPEFG